MKNIDLIISNADPSKKGRKPPDQESVLKIVIWGWVNEIILYLQTGLRNRNLAADCLEHGLSHSQPR